MKKFATVALAAIFSFLFPFMSASAEQVISKEHQKIIEDSICAGGKEMCKVVCAEMKGEPECQMICPQIQETACRKTDQKAAPGKDAKIAKGAICTAVYEQICKWVSCSGTGFDQNECREECRKYLVEVQCN